jgi:glutamyl-tRNA reductase
MALVMCGVNHRTAPVELRERLVLDRVATSEWLQRAPHDTQLGEIAILSTCNRTEVFGVADDVGSAMAAARSLLSQVAHVAALDDTHLYTHVGIEVVQHIMKVACGLDSLVLGERQIIGQVKDAYALARGSGTAGALLDRMFASALHAAKRVHTETAVGSGAVSVASAAIVLAEKVLGSITGRRVLVIGAGETGTLVARHLAKHAPVALLVANRTIERAEALAAAVGGRAIGFDQVGAALAEVDVAVCATRATEPVVTAAMVSRAKPHRHGRSLVLVDIAMPRAVDPAVADADNVFLYPLDALSVVVDHGRERRRRETARAEEIINEEAARFDAWLQSQGALPLLRELHDHFERVRADEVKRSLKHFAPEEQPHVEQLTKALISKLLHAPTMRLKTVDPSADPGRCWADTVRGLFALDTPSKSGGSSHGC